jgi:death on curing protein
MDPVWVLRQTILAIHAEQIAEHGGLEGIRDVGLLESALARPKNLSAYSQNSDAASIAASYTFGLAKNHPFMDGNKRIAFMSGALFLELNGLELVADDSECVLTIVAVADGAMSEDELVDWYRKNSVPKI